MKKTIRISQGDGSYSFNIEDKIMKALIEEGYVADSGNGDVWAKKDFTLVIEAIEDL